VSLCVYLSLCLSLSLCDNNRIPLVSANVQRVQVQYSTTYSTGSLCTLWYCTNPGKILYREQ
jgi:hypothetical protein